MLPPEAVIDIARILGDDERAFIVGGQALNLWAEYYAARAAELNEFRPFTSKDLDYFGQRDVAQKLADGLGGSIRFPDADNATFQTALVTANIRGIEIGIDFLSYILGVRRGLEEGVVDLTIPYRIGEDSGEIAVRLMHPLHCFQSRMANIIKLHRADDTARRQAEAAPIVLREFIAEALEDGDVRAATDTFQALFKYLRRDIYGRQSHKYLRHDPLNIFRHFLHDPRLDERYRTLSLAVMVAQLERRRTALGRVVDTLTGWRTRPEA